MSTVLMLNPALTDLADVTSKTAVGVMQGVVVFRCATSRRMHNYLILLDRMRGVQISLLHVIVLTVSFWIYFSEIDLTKTRQEDTNLQGLLGFAIIWGVRTGYEVIQKRHDLWEEKLFLDLVGVFRRLDNHIIVVGHGYLGSLTLRELFSEFRLGGSGGSGKPSSVLSKLRLKLGLCVELGDVYVAFRDDVVHLCSKLVVVDANPAAISYTQRVYPPLKQLGYERFEVVRRIARDVTIELSDLAIKGDELSGPTSSDSYLIPAYIADGGTRQTWNRDQLRIKSARLILSTVRNSVVDSLLLDLVEPSCTLVIATDVRRDHDYFERKALIRNLVKRDIFNVAEFSGSTLYEVVGLATASQWGCQKVLVVGHAPRGFLYHLIRAHLTKYPEAMRADSDRKLLTGWLIVDERADDYVDVEVKEWDRCFEGGVGELYSEAKKLHHSIQRLASGEEVSLLALLYKGSVDRSLRAIVAHWVPEVIVVLERDPNRVRGYLALLKQVLASRGHSARVVAATPTPELKKEILNYLRADLSLEYGIVTLPALAARELVLMARHLDALGTEPPP